jgi:hypothetical protein
VETQRWLRNAAAAGNEAALGNLAYLLEMRGEVVEAEGWRRDAAAAANTTPSSGCD